MEAIDRWDYLGLRVTLVGVQVMWDLSLMTRYATA
jgi:hypothetical protein